MSQHCCPQCEESPQLQQDRAFRRVLWIALAINAGMFLLEIGAGLAAGSVSLQADALDFLGDSANYGISLFVVGLALHYRALAALTKAATMGAFGLWVIGATIWHAVNGTVPHAVTMGTVGIAALVANAAVFTLLWAYRSGDSNMHSVWICSRNDVLGNLAVLLAALGVFGTGAGWPDMIVAAIMAALALQGAWAVTRNASSELRRTGVEAKLASVHRN
jgi:Co/Zn/Cd efflux system component